MNEFTGVWIAVLFVVVAFIVAMKKGVVKLLASGMAAALGLLVLYGGIYLLPNLAKTYVDIDLTWQVIAGVAAGLAFLVYGVSGIILRVVVKRAFNPDTWLHPLVEGIPGGMVSLFPSAVVVFFLFNCIRVAGTLQELNYVDSLARDGVKDMGGLIPGYPVSSSWRNGVESIPLVAPALDLIDPFSNRANRNAAALVIVSKSEYMKAYLSTLPESAELVEMSGWRDLLSEPAVTLALDKLDRVALVLAPPIRAAARESGSWELKNLMLQPLLKGFVESIPVRPPDPVRVE